MRIHFLGMVRIRRGANDTYNESDRSPVSGILRRCTPQDDIMKEVILSAIQRSEESLG
jgi:hypothetical protein